MSFDGPALTLTIGTTGIVIPDDFRDSRFKYVRVTIETALTAGTYTPWVKAQGITTNGILPCIVAEGNAETMPFTDVTPRTIVFGPFVEGDTFGIDGEAGTVLYQVI